VQKVSIFTIIRARMLIRVAMLLIVLAFAAKLLITNNPFGARAAFTSTATSCALTNTGSGTLDYIPAECENKDVTINGTGAAYTVYADEIKVLQSGTRAGCSDANNENCDSKRVFKSLALKGSTILTHQNVTVGEVNADPDGDLTNNTTGTARWKKVDIELTGGDLNLSGTAEINVNNAGYPGGTYLPYHPNGYGPYGGYGIVEPAEGRIGANGGGNWGNGGRGYCTDNGEGECPNPNGGEFEGLNPAQANSGTIDFNFGSGGGHANQLWNGKTTGADGGNGGGRIRIAVSGDIVLSGNLNKIIAEGAPGATHTEGGDEWEASGAGSGGSILLYATSFITPTTNPAADVHGSRSDGGKILDYSNKYIYMPDSTIPGGLDWSSIKYGLGGDGLFINDTADTKITNISAIGGDNYYYSSPRNVFGGGGGGGQVVLSDGRNQFTIKKKLEPIDRPGDGIGFNPYSLRVDDTIKVVITVTNFQVGRSFKVSDEFLKTPTGAARKCAYVAGSETPTIPTPPQASDTSITWPAYLPTTADVSLGYKEFSYYCKVQ
jgi:hypothetical protein